MRFSVLMSLVLPLTIAACASIATIDLEVSGDCEVPGDMPVSVEVSGSRYLTEYDHFMDGSYEVRTFTKVLVTEPGKYDGAKLLILHPQSAPGDSVWLDDGRALRICISKWSLEHEGAQTPVDSIRILDQQRSISHQPSGFNPCGPQAIRPIRRMSKYWPPVVFEVGRWQP
ncbi:hypothetical protein [Marilutibacter maris]|uniref:hypothetical protein n=1 Tax=Marilutibacter maris TaxID=1605891 RepID=UPI0011AE3136|nr:hypothetical protein [Lysobacter maris]